MIVGNPDAFSIMVDVVDAWNNDKAFNNGLLFMGIDGRLFMTEITTATLNVELPKLIESLKNPKENEYIFQMEKKEAFVHIYNLTNPSDWDLDRDYSYTITPNEFEDHNCLVFMVRNGEKIRILAASELVYDKEESTHNLKNIDVAETYILKEELEEVIEKLSEYEKMISMNLSERVFPERTNV